MAAPTPSLLDWSQIIQRVFDESNGLVRVNAVLSAPVGGIEVLIDQTTDSIAIGDGTSLYTGTTIGSKHGIDVHVLNPNGTSVTDPFIQNILIPTADTEQSIVIPNGTVLLMIKAGAGILSISYTSGGPVFPINPKGNYTVENILTEGITLYIQSSRANDNIQVHGWTTT